MKVGQLVRYTGEFLRSIGVYTGAPENGIIVEMHSPKFARVWWCDMDAGESMLVNVANLELHHSNKYVQQVTRDNLLLEFNEAMV